MSRILETGQAEIGAHFHTWTRVWPFRLPDLGNPPVHACAHQLGQELEEQMLEFTCRAIERCFGLRPLSHRGGRWSLNGQSVKSLRNCGIRVDTTVTPGINWEDRSHPLLSGPDFRGFDSNPFLVSGESLQPRRSGEVLELPVGAAFLPDRKTALDSQFTTKVRRGLRRLVGMPSGVLLLRPTWQTRGEMRACLRELRRHSINVWVAMIHSSEIMPNHYFSTETEVDAFCERCYGLVEDAMELGAVGVSLDDVRKHHELAA